MQKTDFDLLIVGAGAAGLVAAREAVKHGKKVCIVEAKSRLGGRIQTINDSRFPLPIEGGAEFIHGNLPLTLDLLKEAAANFEAVQENFVQYDDEHGFSSGNELFANLDTIQQSLNAVQYDMPIAAFMKNHLVGAEHKKLRQAIKNYAEGYYAADLSTASTLFLKEELEKEEETQYRISEGYVAIINHLSNELKDQCTIILSAPVTEIYWQSGRAEVKSKAQKWTAQKVLVTVSVGVLRAAGIKYYPALPQLQIAARQLGFGAAIKLILLFDDAFWEHKCSEDGIDTKDMGFLFSDEKMPTWWTALPNKVPLLTGWLAGPKALNCSGLLEDEILQTGLGSLCNIFDTDLITLHRKLLSWHVTNWLTDPFTRGGYSFETTTSKEGRKLLQEPIADTLYFAGEGLYEGTAIGTVEAALQSGSDTVKQLLTNF